MAWRELYLTQLQHQGLAVTPHCGGCTNGISFLRLFFICETCFPALGVVVSIVTRFISYSINLLLHLNDHSIPCTQWRIVCWTGNRYEYVVIDSSVCYAESWVFSLHLTLSLSKLPAHPLSKQTQIWTMITTTTNISLLPSTPTIHTR